MSPDELPRRTQHPVSLTVLRCSRVQEPSKMAVLVDVLSFETLAAGDFEERLASDVEGSLHCEIDETTMHISLVGETLQSFRPTQTSSQRSYLVVDDEMRRRAII